MTSKKLTIHVQPRTIPALTFALVALLAIGACSTRSEAPIPEVVAAHTTGAVSAADPIRVRFDRDLTDPESVGTLVDPSPIGLQPKVEGTARWTAPDVLSFQPSSLLEPGRTYEVHLDLGAVAAGETGEVHFEISVMEQSLDVLIEGLKTAGDPDTLELEGVLQTADVADSDSAEQCLTATLGSTTLPIRWSHSGGRAHRFTAGPISRTDEDQAVTVQWDGRPVAASSRGRRDIDVVRVGVFRILGARAVEHPHPVLEIRCSDPIDPDQDLIGLIRVSDHGDLRFDTQANVVTVSATGGWNDEETLRIEPSLRSVKGEILGAPFEKAVRFTPPLPEVRFPGSGVIVPTGDRLTLPVETTALHAVEVEATQVFERNMAQFFQVNGLGDSGELQRVGRVVWQDRIELEPATSDDGTRRWALDLSPLAERHPGGLYRLRFRFNRGDIDFECSEAGDVPTPIPPPGGSAGESSYWDLWENPMEFSWSELYENRRNPCHPGYYRSYYDHDIEVERNVLLSNMGLIAKRTGDGAVVVLATDIRTARPVGGASVTLLDFQQQTLATGLTDAHGMVRLTGGDKAFLVIAEAGADIGYLKLDEGQSLSLSRFDTGGVPVRRGMKGFLFGERGVWRPGDTLHLGFLLHDPEHQLPADHPVVFAFTNPMNQLIERHVQTIGDGPFFVFEPATAPTAVTGDYLAKVTIGDWTHEKTLRIATIRPNRLRIALETDRPELRAPHPQLDGLLEASWLHGAEAGPLETRIEAAFRSVPTTFASAPDFVFDDPSRTVDRESFLLYEGHLDAHGRRRLAVPVPVEAVPPGKLRAQLTTRVFEPGGAFSIAEQSIDLSPYERYVGLRTPPGDAARGMLLTDTPHRVDLALVDQDGRPASGRITVNLYKIAWRWWWEQGRDEGLADFAQSSSLDPIATGTVEVENGEGAWAFTVSYPEWGRYLLLAEDPSTGHRSGKVLFIDWPGWAGKARKGADDGAQILALTADTEKAAVGSEVTVTIPSAADGMILVSIEKGDTILKTDLIEAEADRTRYRFDVIEGMAPNIYVGATFVQPHDHPKNDLPIRMYGVLPLAVDDPRTELHPELEVPSVFEPENTGSIRVSEADGRPMTYTVAVVDEGLLGLTGFATPDPWKGIYRKEALGVRTWDLYDDVVGAWGSALEALLAIGGDEAGGEKPGSRKERRFPPMVRFLGPFHLEAGATTTHDIDIPLYLGSVRVMVVAASGGSYGHAGRDVPIRKPVMALGTLPRQLAPGERLSWPMTVWAMESGTTQVTLTARIDGPASIEGPDTRTLEYSGPGEQSLALPVLVSDSEGSARFGLEVSGRGAKARHESTLDVVHPARPVTEVTHRRLSGGERATLELQSVGTPDRRQAGLEISQTPPIDLSRRLDQLIHYPYGCLEQTVSAAFPQLYLGRLVNLEPERVREIENNVQTAVERIRGFQLPDGSLSLWPAASGGFWDGTPHRPTDPWATVYAGHFLMEAKRAGYRIPPELLQRWEEAVAGAARTFAGTGDAELAIQAYRLKVLALAGAPDLGAMNRLRERSTLPNLARWLLAAAYVHAGQPEGGHDLVAGASTAFPAYRELGGTYGSEVRDEAIVLETLSLLGRFDEARPLADDLSEALSADRPLSTQSAATALRAMAVTAGESADWSFELGKGDDSPDRVKASTPIHHIQLDPNLASVTLLNPADRPLFATLKVRGIPTRSDERSSVQGLKVTTATVDGDGHPVNPASILHATDLDVVVTVRNETGRTLPNVALSVPLANALEIRSVEAGGSVDHVDVRDAAVHAFLDLEAGQAVDIRVRTTAAFKGRFYQPMITAEAMYDPSIAGRLKGRWVDVVDP